MFRLLTLRATIYFCAFYCAIGAQVVRAASDVNLTPDAILKKAEHQRSPWQSMVLNSNLETTKESGQSKESYRVYFKDDSKTLIGFLEPSFDRGNIVLMVGESLWFYAKNTSRPTRITPIQRLSGSVSYGDITRLGWSNDYSIAEFKDIKPETGVASKADIAYKFVLLSKSPSATYQKIELTVDAEFKARLAEVYLLSGKHYKTLEFLDYELVDGEYINTKIRFTDRLAKNNISILQFTNIDKNVDVPNEFFLKEGMSDFSKRFVLE